MWKEVPRSADTKERSPVQSPCRVVTSVTHDSQSPSPRPSSEWRQKHSPPSSGVDAKKKLPLDLAIPLKKTAKSLPQLEVILEY